ncbi:M6 family metalloprotease domain-containing protein [Planomicrobium sp. CPCC 101079]|uniref:M6 family metalloprotease domain-containing protein n=1 Tax=Planomicrobium sp. CPCC 101079 TaxID=2599618 RepID=UPI0011B42A59|nr:M6 family metalloprotease domain-containing protein [Planomicrobium sp. CPCC 101079]TWT06181.1 M6 family metalloprotease domain-containing protein [Planomicrobium sp. CPCC 101079]
MLKVLSTSFLSLAVAGAAIFAGTGAPAAPAEQPSKYNLNPAEHVGAAPELADKAKKLGIDLSKADPVEKIAGNGTKFEAPGDNHVAYNSTQGDVPVLVLLAKYKGDDQPVGDMPGQVPAHYYEDLIFGNEYNPYELPQFEQYAEFNGVKAPTDSTMQNVYKESSNGKVNLVRKENTEFVWVELPKGASYYLDQEGTYAEDGTYVLGNVNGDAHTGEFVRDLLKAADEQVDFSKYAVDGEVPNVFVVHEGTGAEFSSDPAQFWSHKWSLLSALYYGKYYETGKPADVYEGKSQSQWINETVIEDMTYDGVVVDNYNIQPGIGGNVAGYDAATGTYSDAAKTGPYPAQPGVYAHEFGHALGLPDFYDTVYSSEGVGNYSMMSGGSWMRYPDGNAYSGNAPTHFDPFSKIFLGWTTPVEVKPESGVKEITLPAINKAAADNGIVKMEVPGSNGTEYFLFENVQQDGFNKGLNRQGTDAHGLLAWHVDENVLNLYQTAGFRPNNVENWMNKRFQYNQFDTASDGTKVTHYGLSLLQADGKYDLEKNANRGDAGDFFKTGSKITPTSSNVHTGSYYFWKGNSKTPADSGINVTDIVENKDGSITAKFFYSK